jgi:putative ABC transport system permease protein
MTWHDWWSDLRYRLRALTGRAALERELDEELRFHLERETEALIGQGVPPAEALRRARLAFGSVQDVKESSREARGLGALERGTRDLARAFRQARLQPGLTLVVALSLALGIGTTTAVWNLTYSVLFASLEVPHPEQLVVLSRHTHEGSDIGFSWAEYTTLRETPGLGRFASFRGASAITLEVAGRRESINVHFVDGDYFALAGVTALRGRLLTRADDASGAPVAVLAQWYAEKLFPGDSAVLGRVIKLRGAAFTVVGVLPHAFRGFEFPGWLTVAIPEGAVPRLAGYAPGRDNRGQSYGREDVRRTAAPAFHIVGRLAIPASSAQAALDRTFARCCRTASDERLELVDIRLGLGGGKEDIRVGGRLVLTLLLGGMALVLVVICCNVASLLPSASRTASWSPRACHTPSWAG